MIVDLDDHGWTFRGFIVVDGQASQRVDLDGNRRSRRIGHRGGRIRRRT
jgi:hypothetical protein